MLLADLTLILFTDVNTLLKDLLSDNYDGNLNLPVINANNSTEVTTDELMDSHPHILLIFQGKVQVAQSCLTLCDPINYIVHGILQCGILEWVAFPFSRGSSQPRN